MEIKNKLSIYAKPGNIYVQNSVNNNEYLSR